MALLRREGSNSPSKSMTSFLLQDIKIKYGEIY